MYDVNRDKTVFNEERKRFSMKKMHFVIIGLLIIGFTTGCSQNDETNTNQEEKVIPIEVVEATEEDLVIEKSLYGRTAPKRTTPIVVQMPGEIDELKVENEDKVEEGDIIATLMKKTKNKYTYQTQQRTQPQSTSKSREKLNN